MRLRKNEQHNLTTFFQEMLVHNTYDSYKRTKKISMEPPFFRTTAPLVAV